MTFYLISGNGKEEEEARGKRPEEERGGGLLPVWGGGGGRGFAVASRGRMNGNRCLLYLIE